MTEYKTELSADTPTGLVGQCIASITAALETAAVAGAEAIRAEAGLMADVWMARYDERRACAEMLKKLREKIGELEVRRREVMRPYCEKLLALADRVDALNIPAPNLAREDERRLACEVAEHLEVCANHIRESVKAGGIE